MAAPDNLPATLAAHYRIERELGRGGMATVYLARDLRHDREVAIKVLHPELSEAVPAERFLREIRIEARLQHPLIVPLYDSGAADGALFYVMPYVEGESLRDRLTRERHLSVADAVRIASDVADALGYAHAHGVIHRDIKPENIMLSGGHALVADFGIARAVQASDEGRLTQTGMSLGTPAYMSPEQAVGEAAIDARSDIYSLGCVIYEMLAGEPPFTGPSTQAVIARHVAQPPPPLAVVRPGLDPHVQLTVERALAKVPVDRFATAGELAAALATPSTTGTPTGVVTRPVTRAPRVRRDLAVAATAIVAAAVVWFGWGRWGRGAREINPTLVAIAPINVIDTASELGLWREGLMDLLAQNLNGAGPLRVVAPSVVLRTWRGTADESSVERLGRQTGAGLAIFGSLTRTGGDSVRFNATVLDRTSHVTPSQVDGRGAATRMDVIADTATVRLLRTINGWRMIGAVRLALARSSSLPALKAYLQGEQLFRRTAWDSARVFYEQAVELDSTFAVALHRLYQTRFLKGNAAEDTSLWAPALRAGALNHGLGLRDSLLIVADSVFAAMNIGLTTGDTLVGAQRRRMLAILDDASRRFRDDPEVWYRLAQARWRDGWAERIDGSKILEAYDRAIALDSAFAPAYVEPMDIVMRERGPEAMRRHLRAYLQLSPTGTQGDAARLALRLLDSRQARAAKIEQTLDTVSSAALFWALQPLLWWSDSAETALRVARRLVARSDDPTVSASAARLFYARQLAWRGHVRDAYPALQRGVSAGLLGELALLDGLPVDSAAAVFGRQLTRAAAAMPRIDVALPWWATHGDTASLLRASARGDSLVRATAERQLVAFGTYLSTAARAYLALARRDTTAALERFLTLPDTVTQNSLGDMDRFTTIRLLIARGRYADARTRLTRETRSRISALDALMLFSRAQVADHFGERDAAVALYEQVVAIWGRADPHLQPVVTEARAALRRLGGS